MRAQRDSRLSSHAAGLSMLRTAHCLYCYASHHLCCSLLPCLLLSVCWLCLKSQVISAAHRLCTRSRAVAGDCAAVHSKKQGMIAAYKQHVNVVPHLEFTCEQMCKESSFSFKLEIKKPLRGICIIFFRIDLSLHVFFCGASAFNHTPTVTLLVV